MSEITEIYRKLGLNIDHYQGPGGEDYKQFKLQRFKDRLKVCLYFERCLEVKGLAFQNLSEEEKLQLKSTTLLENSLPHLLVGEKEN